MYAAQVVNAAADPEPGPGGRGLDYCALAPPTTVAGPNDPDTDDDDEEEEAPALIRCPRCGGPATWTEKQTRGADEATTQFCRCRRCHHAWRQN